MTPPQHRAEPAARTSTTPSGRSLGFERGLVLVVGLLILLAGILALIVGAGWFGGFRAQRSVLDPIAVQWWNAYPQVGIPVAIVLGIVLLGLGLWWLARALRPDPRPDLRLEDEPGLIVTSSALGNAIRTDAESMTGVSRARVRIAGSQRSPNLRLNLSLQEGTDVRQVWDELDDKVLAKARESLETETIPTAIRLQLDRAPRQRVH